MTENLSRQVALLRSANRLQQALLSKLSQRILSLANHGANCGCSECAQCRDIIAISEAFE